MKRYIQPRTQLLVVENAALIAGSIGIGNSPISGGEDGFEKAAATARTTDWGDYENR